MVGLTTIVTATYNKEMFLPQAAESIFSQTRRDWRWWIILDGANEQTSDFVFSLQHRDPRVTVFVEHVNFHERKQIYRPSMLMNKYFPLIATDYFCWLSDDDIMQPTYLESLAGALDSHPNWDVVFGWMDVIDQISDNDWKLHMYFGRHHWNREYNEYDLPMFKLDGGQILQTKTSYNNLQGWQFSNEWANGNACDGLYLNELAKKFTLHPINEHVLTHRRTYLSENTSVNLKFENIQNEN